MKNDKRKRRARVILVIIITAAVVACYVLPLATMGVAATEPPATGGEEFGTDAPFPPLPPEEKKPPATIEILPYPSDIDVDSRFNFQCIITNGPVGIDEEWSSSNPGVLIVDPTGSALALAPGNAEVTVIAGDLRASVIVHVNDLKANKLSLVVVDVEGTPSPMGRITYTIEVGDVVRINYRIEPKGAWFESTSWTLSDSDLAELSKDGELIALAAGDVSVTLSAGALSDTVYFTIKENGVPIETLYKYIILIVIIIVIIVVVAFIISRSVNIRKEEDRQRAIVAKRRKEEARRRAEEARKKAADEAEMAALVEKNKQILDVENTAHRSAKVSGATVSAIGNANKTHIDGEERPLTLDDIE